MHGAKRIESARLIEIAKACVSERTCSQLLERGTLPKGVRCPQCGDDKSQQIHTQGFNLRFLKQGETKARK